MGRLGAGDREQEGIPGASGRDHGLGLGIRCYRASEFQREGSLGSNSSPYSPLLMARREWPTVYSRQGELDSRTDTQAVSD